MGETYPGIGEDRAPSLEGILVADFSRVLSGPYATMILGDLGATVVKVERPGDGDESRTWGPPFIGDTSTYYLAVNRNKVSVALDLRNSDDRELAQELAAEADVLVENFRPGTMDRFGLGYDELVRANPRLIYCSISGFGRHEGVQLAGYDLLLQAVGGLMSITGHEDGEPVKVGVAVVDVITGLFATIGILAALAERERSGQGQRVDVSLLVALLSSLVNQASSFLATGVPASRTGNHHPSLAPYGLYRAADGELVIAVGNERQFRDLAQTIGRDDLVGDPRFATNAGRVTHHDELRNVIETALKRAPSRHWLPRLQASGVPCGEVQDIKEAFELATQLGLAPSFDLTAPEGGTVPQVRNPIELSATPAEYRLAPPRLGEHTSRLEAILARFERAKTNAADA